MKLRKLDPKNDTSKSPTSLRQEIDIIIKNIGKLVGKNPKKAALTIENWLSARHSTNKNSTQKKRAA